jgi:hypothetical protein
MTDVTIAFDSTYGRVTPGILMAQDGIVYTSENEDKLIGTMFEYMITKCGYSKKSANYYLNYDEDFIGDNLQCLPRG